VNVDVGWDGDPDRLSQTSGTGAYSHPPWDHCPIRQVWYGGQVNLGSKVFENNGRACARNSEIEYRVKGRSTPFFLLFLITAGLGFGRLRFYLIQVDSLTNLIYPIII